MIELEGQRVYFVFLGRGVESDEDNHKENEDAPGKFDVSEVR